MSGYRLRIIHFRLRNTSLMAFATCLFTASSIQFSASAEEPVVKQQTSNDRSEVITNNKDVSQPTSNQSVSLDSVDDRAKTSASDTPESTDQTTTGSSPSLTRRPPLAMTPGTSSIDLPWYRSGFIPLLLVLGVIVLAYMLVRRFMPGRAITGSGILRVVSRTALSPKHSMALVQVGTSRFVLVGVAGERVTPISDISDPDEVSALMVRANADSVNHRSDSFGDLLQDQSQEYLESTEDVGDSIIDDPNGLDVAKVRLSGLVKRLKTMRERV